jgi:hypothetical protein
MVFTATKSFASGFLLTVLFLFFLLAKLASACDTFLRRLVEILRDFGDKRRAVESQTLESGISTIYSRLPLRMPQSALPQEL